MLGICDKGFLIDFFFAAWGDFWPPPQQHSTSQLPLSPTSNACYELVKRSLPYTTKQFTIFFDNYFTNVRLFHKLREELGVGACGTVRSNSAEYPDEHKRVNKTKDILPVGFISGVRVRSVLSLIWQDRQIVRFLSTVHSGYGTKERSRRAPREHNIITKQIRAVLFGDEKRCIINTPDFAADYNDNMNGVDIADQYRSYYSTQLICRRNWYPLFFWILDHAITNSFLLCRLYFPKTQGTQLPGHLHKHLEFRSRLSWVLVIMGANMVDPTYLSRRARHDCGEASLNTGRGMRCGFGVPKGNNRSSRWQKYVSGNYQLSPMRLAPGAHEPIPNGLSYEPLCIYCRYIDQHRRRTGEQRGKVGRTTRKCGFCDVPLCRRCFELYHQPEASIAN